MRKFGFFTGFALWTLGRSRRGNEGPTIFTRLSGQATLLDVLPTMFMPITAAAVYAGFKAMNPSEEFIREYCYYGLVWTQVVVGSAAFVWAVATSFVRNRATNAELAN